MTHSSEACGPNPRAVCPECGKTVNLQFPGGNAEAAHVMENHKPADSPDDVDCPGSGKVPKKE